MHIVFSLVRKVIVYNHRKVVHGGGEEVGGRAVGAGDEYERTVFRKKANTETSDLGEAEDDTENDTVLAAESDTSEASEAEYSIKY